MLLIPAILQHWPGTFHLRGWVSFNYKSTTVNDTKTTMQKKMAKKYGIAAAQLHKILKPFYTSIAKI